jgi:hypothetical protein
MATVLFPKGNDFDSLEFDTVITQNHGASAQVTSHPVEDGSEITDHVRPQPKTLGLRGLVTQDKGVEGEPLGSIVAGGTPDTRPQDAFDYLNRQLEAGTLFEVTTTLRDYSDMVIESLSATRDIKGNILDVQVNLRGISIVETQRVEAPPREPKNKSRKPKTDGGPQTKKEVTEPAQQSFLERTARKFGLVP